MSQAWSAIDNCAAQFHRLDCDGNILTGARDVVVTCSPVSNSTDPQSAGGVTENRDPNGQGRYCAERIIQPKVEWVNVSLVLCSRTDAELMELLGIWDLIYDTDGTTVVGVKSKCCSEEICRCEYSPEECEDSGIAMMLWHTAWLGKRRHPDYSHAVEIWPKVNFDPTSVVVDRGAEFTTYTLTGRGECNPSFGQGPGLIVPDANGMTACWGELLTNVTPMEMCSCDACGYTSEFVGA